MKLSAVVVISALVILVGAGVTVGLTTASDQGAPAQQQPNLTAAAEPKSPVSSPVMESESLPSQAKSDGDQPSLPEPQIRELEHRELGSQLDQMVAEAKQDRAAPQGVEPEEGDAAPAPPLEPVLVTVLLSGNAADVVAFLEDNGGDVRNSGEDYIEAYVPVLLLGELADQPGVLRVREIILPLSP